MEPGLRQIRHDRGSFTIRLFDKEAPNTVANFVGLAEGTKEWKRPGHRREEEGAVSTTASSSTASSTGFMIQGGDPLGPGTGGPGYKFGDEFHPSLRHDKAGILSMANAGPGHQRQPVLHHARPTPHLDNRHSVFGEVVDGTRRRQEDRLGADRPSGSPGHAGRHEQGDDRAGRVAIMDDRQSLDSLLPVVYQDCDGSRPTICAASVPARRCSRPASCTRPISGCMKDRPDRWQNRAHFCAIAAHSMRQILIERARARGAQKRGGAQARVTLDEGARRRRRAVVRHPGARRRARTTGRARRRAGAARRAALLRRTHRRRNRGSDVDLAGHRQTPLGDRPRLACPRAGGQLAA